MSSESKFRSGFLVVREDRLREAYTDVADNLTKAQNKARALALDPNDSCGEDWVILKVISETEVIVRVNLVEVTDEAEK